MRDDTFDPRPNPAANPPEPVDTPAEASSRPKSGVFGFGATASAYFIVVALLFLVFVALIVSLQ